MRLVPPRQDFEQPVDRRDMPTVLDPVIPQLGIEKVLRRKGLFHELGAPVGQTHPPKPPSEAEGIVGRLLRDR